MFPRNRPLCSRSIKNEKAYSQTEIETDESPAETDILTKELKNEPESDKIKETNIKEGVVDYGIEQGGTDFENDERYSQVQAKEISEGVQSRSTEIVDRKSERAYKTFKRNRNIQGH